LRSQNSKEWSRIPVSLFVLALLLAAAFLHTGWNLLVKRAREKQIFTWWSLVVGSVCFTPMLLFSPPLPVAVWPYVVASAVVETIYYLALLRAYSIGDFSLVYPLARGAAPAFLALWGALFLGERLRIGGAVGLGLLLVGLLLVGSAAGRLVASQRLSGEQEFARAAPVAGLAVNGRAVAAALTVALCISIYSAIDGAAMRLASPVPYTVAIIGMSALMITPAVLWRYGQGAILAEWRLNWPRIAAVGLLTQVTYLLVLQAYALGRVSYAGAVREVSVVFAALIGWRWLGEGFGGLRTAGALLIFAGILVIAVAG
jgi:drug/metabolite transporter (DMT)-like permease